MRRLPICKAVRYQLICSVFAVTKDTLRLVSRHPEDLEGQCSPTEKGLLSGYAILLAADVLQLWRTQCHYC